MKPYHIMLADDHLLMREGIRNVINAKPGLTVIGEASDGLELLRLLNKTIPDMVILDIAMPGLRGVETAREIKSRYPEIQVLFLSMHNSREFLSSAFAVGAKGYLLKEDSSDELLTAIETVRKGRTYLSEKILGQYRSDIIDIFTGGIEKNINPLTHRESQVLKLIAEGNTDRQIGEMLFISPRTVNRHRFNIRGKLNLKHTADLVKYAMTMGLTEKPG